MHLTINIPVGTARIIAERADYAGIGLIDYVEKEIVKLSRLKITGHAYRKTHCPQGHEYTPENSYINPSTSSRLCRQCRREKNLARYYKRTEDYTTREPKKGRKRY